MLWIDLQGVYKQEVSTYRRTDRQLANIQTDRQRQTEMIRLKIHIDKNTNRLTFKETEKQASRQIKCRQKDRQL